LFSSIKLTHLFPSAFFFGRVDQLLVIVVAQDNNMQFLRVSSILAMWAVGMPTHHVAGFTVAPNAITKTNTQIRPITTALHMVMDKAMAERLNGIRRSYQALTERLGDPDVINDSNLLRKVMSDRSTIEDAVLAYEEYTGFQEELEGARELFESGDSELREMAREEIKEIEPKMEELEERIKILMLPKDPNDDRNIMLEIRAGTGGSEANIFAGMYNYFIYSYLYGGYISWIFPANLFAFFSFGFAFHDFEFHDLLYR